MVIEKNICIEVRFFFENDRLKGAYGRGSSNNIEFGLISNEEYTLSKKDYQDYLIFLIQKDYSKNVQDNPGKNLVEIIHESVLKNCKFNENISLHLDNLDHYDPYYESTDSNHWREG